jgi:hypothetical protein
MKNVKITKIAEAPEPKYKSADWNKYKVGEDNDNLSLPIEYWCEGSLLRPIEVGYGIVLARRTRNGVEMYGTMMTSKVISIDADKVTTTNSVYKIEYLE